MRGTLEGRVAIVTGASGGIGAATAVALAASGASVALAARNREKLEEVTHGILASGGRAVAVETDVTDRDSVSRMVEGVVGRLGSPDILVNNAGLGLSGRVEEIRPEDLRYVYEVNVIGVLNCLQVTLPAMKSCGRVVNISSVVGKRSLPMVGGYCSSKSALNALSDSLRVELASRNISVTSVYPGTTTTDFKINARRTKDEKRGWRPSGVPPERVAREVLRAVSAAKSPRDVYITPRDRAFAAAAALFPGVLDLVLRRWTKG